MKKRPSFGKEYKFLEKLVFVGLLLICSVVDIKTDIFINL